MPTVPKKVGVTKKNNSPTFKQHQTHLKAGDRAPFFEGINQQGQKIDIASFPGKSLVLYFYPKDATPACTAEACSLRDEFNLLGKKGFVVIGVSADKVETHKKFATKYELPFSLIADTDFSIIKAYNVWGKKMLAGRIYDGIVRTTFIISPDGVIKEVIKKVDTVNHAQQILAL